MAGVLVRGIPGICPPFARQAIRDGRKGIEIIEAVGCGITYQTWERRRMNKIEYVQDISGSPEETKATL